LAYYVQFKRVLVLMFRLVHWRGAGSPELLLVTPLRDRNLINADQNNRRKPNCNI